jgi:hypothetical protein
MLDRTVMDLPRYTRAEQQSNNIPFLITSEDLGQGTKRPPEPSFL